MIYMEELRKLVGKTFLNSLVAVCVGAFLTASGYVLTSVFQVRIPALEIFDQVNTIANDSAATRRIAEDNRAGIQDNRKAILDLRIAQDVAEYDETLSGVLGGCRIGTVCIAKFYLRRTEFGLNCGLPSAIPYVENHSRAPIRTQFVGFKPVEVGRDWETLETPFRVPNSALPGDGGFYVRIEYPGCVPDDPDGLIYESTITLPFEILPAE
ncbi:hypothetical protein [Ahrensia sp. R2A130]|uniref:hypothetical protein n=1 Tax=Ahrensia sp. R2A130 TaxID=744979 RepID=UPI0001E0B4F9|nr:hypothetical protein [Ahrensia sp. R2A130]EFL88263.1 conserved hypothetical protein [Ahrensia sp. R2A130]